MIFRLQNRFSWKETKDYGDRKMSLREVDHKRGSIKARCDIQTKSSKKYIEEELVERLRTRIARERIDGVGGVWLI